MPDNCDEWWREAELEIARARTLKSTGDAHGAYHHAGQAVEFAIKALYLKRNGLGPMPEECKGARWHDLKFIAEQARCTLIYGQRPQ